MSGPMETMEIEGTPSESPAPKATEEADSKKHGRDLARKLAVENLDEFSCDYSPQELMNARLQRDGVEGGRAVARGFPDPTKIGHQISRAKKIAARAIRSIHAGRCAQQKYGGSSSSCASKRRIKKTKVLLLFDVSGSMTATVDS